ncbi:DUF6291 domain-containing protein [Muribaculum gordoncarteri]|jgi:hypothetical protein|uniref:DUF6291 domain-containing protein n=3 Tax=Muribaculum TaxID=1918540 RepID=A0A4P7VNJ0_9BACT|nr:DUF6291 domain-containing protein [Muribaculum gordoncarteri]QCD35411.1 hypothetical protein E7746_05615 [Muribaculum gordoncarteri]
METSHNKRGPKFKFDKEWTDAIIRLPKHYQDELYNAIEAYQRDLTVIDVSEGVPRAIFMLIMPTIRRRYIARQNSRMARDRKRAVRSSDMKEKSSKIHNSPNICSSEPETEPIAANPPQIAKSTPKDTNKKRHRNALKRLKRHASRRDKSLPPI